MIVGIPRETKAHEYRVGILPVGVEELTRAGHTVLVEHSAGSGSGISDDDYLGHGARIVDSSDEVWGAADMIVKVKEPQPDELQRIRPGQLVFAYFHLAADRRLAVGLVDSGATALAYETLRDEGGRRPLLTPMSEIAGRMSIQEGAKYLERPQEGRGILLGGVPGVLPAHVVVLGAGVVGASAGRIASGMGANVVMLDVDVERLRFIEDVMPRNVTTLFSDRLTIREQLIQADLVIGAVLVEGARAPVLVEMADLTPMKSGAVVVDVAIDQGGCFETSRPTTHGAPTYIVEGVLHYCVTNMPGAVGRTSTYALCNVTLPYVLKLANGGPIGVGSGDPRLASAINVHRGRITNRAVAETFGLDYAPYAG